MPGAGRGPGTAADLGNVVGMGMPAAGAHETWVEVTRLQTGLCGASRPHFFRGVATVRLALLSGLGRQFVAESVPPLSQRGNCAPQRCMILSMRHSFILC